MIETKSDLRNAIREFLSERDLPDQTIDLFISLCEADLNRRARLLVDNRSDELTLTNGEVFLPSGFRELRAVFLTDRPECRLELLPTYDLHRLRGSDTGVGQPRYYAVEGRGDAGLPALVVAPRPDGDTTVTLLYEADCSLIDDDSSNTLLLRHLDAYLYGSLIHAEGYLENPQNVGTYAGMFGNAIAQIEADETRQTFGGPLIMGSNFSDGRRMGYR